MVALARQYPTFGILLATILAGGWVLSDYAYRPCPQGTIPGRLDHIESLPLSLHWRPEDRQAILMVSYHPHCPCTSATIRNLERVWNRVAKDTKVVALAYCPKNEEENWIESKLTASLTQSLKANVIVDVDGRLARQLGVMTSGHILVFDENGRLAFSGGITPGRGHEGDCPASKQLESVLELGTHDERRWPVFGCSLGRPLESQGVKP